MVRKVSPSLLDRAKGALFFQSMVPSCRALAFPLMALGDRRGLVVGGVVVGYASLALLEEYVGIVDRCSIVVVVSGFVFVVIVSWDIVRDQ